jgi:hypothetical protein
MGEIEKRRQVGALQIAAGYASRRLPAPHPMGEGERKIERVSIATTHAHPIPCCAGFGFLHVMSAPVTSMTTTPAPVAAIVIPILAAVHPVSIIVLSRSAG